MSRQFHYRILTVLLALIVGARLAPADESKQNWAIKMFAQPKFDFGPVAQHSDCQGNLELTNCFDPEMEVVKVSTSCKCISASTEIKSLKPHETGKIKLVLDTSRFQGQRHVTLTVQFRFNGSSYATVNIPCSAFIRTDVWMQPSFANLGSVTAGQGGEQRVRVTRTGNESWQIREVKSRFPGLTTELKELSRGAGKVEYEVLVKVSPEAPMGSIQESLILVTNDTSNANVALRVEGKVETDIQITPDVVALGRMTPGKETKVMVVVKSKKPVRLEQLGFATHPEAFRVTLPTDEKTIHVLSIVVTPPDTTGDFQETCTLSVAGRPQPLQFKASGSVASVETAGTP